MTRLLPAERAALVKARVDADALERGLLRGAARTAAFALLSQLRQGEHAPRLARSPDHDALAAAFATRNACDYMNGRARSRLGASTRAVPGLPSRQYGAAR